MVKHLLTTNEKEPNWQRIAIEYRCYPATMGAFHRTLCEAIMKADIKNTAKLRLAYPELVKYLKGEADPCPE